MRKPVRQLHRFGSFILEPTRKSLIREATGEHVRLSDRQFNMLCLFVRNPNRLYSTEELLGEFWPDRIVEDNNLTQNITALRKALGEKPGENKYIQTIGKGGYRFVAQVAVIEVHHGDEGLGKEIPAQIAEGKPQTQSPSEADKPSAPAGAGGPVSTQTPARRPAGNVPLHGMDSFEEWLDGPGRFIKLVLAVCITLTVALSGLGIYNRWEWTNLSVSIAQSIVLIIVIFFSRAWAEGLSPD